MAARTSSALPSSAHSLAGSFLDSLALFLFRVAAGDLLLITGIWSCRRNDPTGYATV
jgi:hypothetical protein